MQVIPLHIHSEYSLIDSILRVGDIIDFAKAERLDAAALTDRNNLYGGIKFYKKARAAGIKPILGCDLSVRALDGSVFQLILLAMNVQGFRHLNALISLAYEEDQIGEEVAVNIARLTAEACEGLIALSGIEGDIAPLADSRSEAAARARHWQAVFGDRFYFLLSRTQKAGEEAWIACAQLLGSELGIAAAAANMACFKTAADYPVHDIRTGISGGWMLEQPNRPHRYTPANCLHDAPAMFELFAGMRTVLENTEIIAQRCNLTLELGTSKLPDFPLPDGMNIQDFLTAEAEKGLEERLIQLFPDAQEREARAPEYRERLRTELQVIITMGFPGYFLIVADFIQWAKDNDVPVGPGRGSGAGSLAAYALKITDLDPLEYDLLFERFLNPERVSMPDFDVDFCMDKRDRVIRYVSEKYGHEKVSQIATHGTMAAKAVIRDVGRVQGLPYPVCDRISKMVPAALGVTLSDALGRTEKSQAKPEFFSEELKNAYDSNDEVRELIDAALALEGLARSVGKHAGGVVIAPTRLTDFSPLYTEAAHAGLVTQFDKDDIEAAGLVKFDFLGLRTLTVIDWALEHVNKRRAREGKPDLDINSIALDDKATFDLLKSTKTSAVFQLESSGMKNLIKKLQPDTFEDIIALVALFRPGPLGSGMVDDFINRKHGAAEVSYPHPALEGILENTYGVMVYQEQVMQVAQVLANYSLGEADNLRRAMGKKKKEEMDKNKIKFCERAIADGVNPQVANDIFDLMAKFAEYGFNKSHSAAYALLSYQTAWLKAHYPAELMAAVLTSDMDKIDKVVPMVNEVLDMGIEILPPCINRSLYRFTVNEEGAILFGLGAVKGVGENAVKVLIDEREANGPYASILDLCGRVDLKTINKNTLESLIEAGAFDNIEPNRGGLFAILPEAVKLANQHHTAVNSAQADLFGGPISAEADSSPLLIVPKTAKWELMEKLTHEKRALGLYLTDHPVSGVVANMRRLCEPLHSAASRFAEMGEPHSMKEVHRLLIGGLVADVRQIVTKKGKRMAFVTLDDRSARFEVTLFEEQLKENAELLRTDSILLIEASAKYAAYQGQWRITAESIEDFHRAQYTRAKSMLIQTDTAAFTDSAYDVLAKMREAARAAAEQGDTAAGGSVRLQLQSASGQAAGDVYLQGRYLFNRDYCQALAAALGDKAVELCY